MSDPGKDSNVLLGGLRSQGAFIRTDRPDKPLVSIVTVVLNGERHIEQTIQSVLGQNYDNIEYIIIDGNSSDRTLDIIRRYDDRIAYWKSEPDGGIYDAMNQGIALSSGTLINLLNADDYLEPQAVDRVVRTYLRVNCPKAIVYGNAFAVDDIHHVRAELFSTMRYWVGMTINHQAMFVHKGVYHEVGPYNSGYRLAADYDFLVRCRRKDVQFLPIPGCLVNFRNRGLSVRESGLHRKEANEICKQYFGSFSIKRWDFIIFNYIWMPLKLSVRAVLYTTVGVAGSRKMIDIYKKIVFGLNRHSKV